MHPVRDALSEGKKNFQYPFVSRMDVLSVKKIVKKLKK